LQLVHTVGTYTRCSKDMNDYDSVSVQDPFHKERLIKLTYLQHELKKIKIIVTHFIY
jgi:hypothetical protein